MAETSTRKRRGRINALEAEQAVLDALIDWREEHGYSPTHAELAKVTGYAVGSVHRVAMRLAVNGAIAYQPTRGASRTMVPLRIDARLPEPVSAPARTMRARTAGDIL